MVHVGIRGFEIHRVIFWSQFDFCLQLVDYSYRTPSLCVYMLMPTKCESVLLVPLVLFPFCPPNIPVVPSKFWLELSARYGEVG